MMREEKIALCLIFCLKLVGCKDTVSSAGAVPHGVLSAHYGCKTFDPASSSEPSLQAGNVECAVYRYDSEGRLDLIHINSGFNCCPGNITAEVVFSGNTIVIQEKEAHQECFCQCLFDLTYEVFDLEPGHYTVEIRGPYIQEADEVLRSGVRLRGTSSGTFCVDRTHYPWSTPN